MQQSGLIYDRIFLNDKPADLAFFGTSHTIDGICDYRMEDSLRELGLPLHVLTLGYCRLGRNAPYVILKDLLKFKQPQCIVIEVTEKENRDGHMDFAYLADTKDVLFPELIFNDNIFQDWFKALVVRFESKKRKLFGQYDLPPVNKVNYGHREDWSIINKDELKRQQENKLKNYKYTTGFARWFYNKYSFNYIKEMVKMAKDRGIKVVFLYTPEIASVSLPEELEFYKQFGDVLIPPDEIYQNPQYWKDVKHMNDHGAYAMAGWLSRSLAPYLKPPN